MTTASDSEFPPRLDASAHGIGWNVADDRPAKVEDWEQIRRSVAMLRPGAWAMRREQALSVLAALVEAQRPRSES